MIPLVALCAIKLTFALSHEEIRRPRKLLQVGVNDASKRPQEPLKRPDSKLLACCRSSTWTLKIESPALSRGCTELFQEMTCQPEKGCSHLSLGLVVTSLSAYERAFLNTSTTALTLNVSAWHLSQYDFMGNGSSRDSMKLSFWLSCSQWRGHTIIQACPLWACPKKTFRCISSRLEMIDNRNIS